MRTKELLELGEDELVHKRAEVRDQLFKLRFQHELGQLENFAKMNALRKDIARIETLLQEIRTKASA